MPEGFIFLFCHGTVKVICIALVVTRSGKYFIVIQRFCRNNRCCCIVEIKPVSPVRALILSPNASDVSGPEAKITVPSAGISVTSSLVNCNIRMSFTFFVTISLNKWRSTAKAPPAVQQSHQHIP